MKSFKKSTRLLIMSGLLLFAACEKEGIYNPDRKISKTTIAASAIVSGRPIDVPAVDEMTFTWDGDRLDNNIQQVTANSQTKGEAIVIADFVWKGDNVEKMLLTSPTSPTDTNMQVDILFEYDTHANPLLHAYSISTPVLMRDESYLIHSANNMTNYQEVTPKKTSSVDFTYTYDGDYPVTRSYTLHEGEDVETYTRAYIYQ